MRCQLVYPGGVPQQLWESQPIHNGQTRNGKGHLVAGPLLPSPPRQAQEPQDVLVRIRPSGPDWVFGIFHGSANGLDTYTLKYVSSVASSTRLIQQA